MGDADCFCKQIMRLNIASQIQQYPDLKKFE